MGVDDTQHNCSWTRRKQIDISYNGESVSGAGMGLRAMTASFPRDSNWHLRLFGEFDDDVVALSFSDEAAAGLPTSAPITLDNVSLPGSACVLSDEICTYLSIGPEEDGFSLPDQAEVTRELRIHDDCFYFATPVDKETLKTVIEEIIRIQEGYLRLSIDTRECRTWLEKLVHAYPSVRVRSFPQKATIRAAYKDTQRRFLRWKYSEFVARTSEHAS